MGRQCGTCKNWFPAGELKYGYCSGCWTGGPAETAGPTPNGEPGQ